LTNCFSPHQASVTSLGSSWNSDHELMEEALAGGKVSTTVRWTIENGLWSFLVKNTMDFIKMTELMSLESVIDRGKCPVLVGDAADDLFFKGQPALVAAPLGDKATHLVLAADDAASLHCHVGALSFANHLFYDWLEDVFSSKRMKESKHM